jgi:hypothetical protein
MLGINDATDQLAPPTWIGNIQTIAQAAAVSGDVILMSMIPTNPTVNSGHNDSYEAQYVPLLLQQTWPTFTYPFLDLYRRTNGFTAWNTLGMMAGDGIHGNDYAYWDIARFITNALATV